MEPQLSPEQREALIARLKGPFHPHDVHWRVLRKQKGNDKRGEVVAYVKSSAYRERLTELFTISGWTSQCEILMGADLPRLKGKANIVTGKVMVRYTVTIHGLGTHSSTGEAWADDDNALTTAEAQAFKRTCAIFGLGEYISRLEKPWVDLDDYGNIVDKNGKKYSPPLPDWALPMKYLEEWGPQMSQQPACQQQSSQQRTPAPAPAQEQGQGTAAPAQQQAQAAHVATSAPTQHPAQPHTTVVSVLPQAPTKEGLERLFGAFKARLGTALFKSITTMVCEGFEQNKYSGDKNLTALEFMDRAAQAVQNIREMAAKVGDDVFIFNMDKLNIRSLSEIQAVGDLIELKSAMESSVKMKILKAA
ncbi:MAG: Rad52/Rad22 family DNA repair protein [Acidobacteriaceae bacterium]